MLSPDELNERARRVRLVLLDLDGVLTDGSILFDDQGGEVKRFHVRDGFAIQSWKMAGGHIAVLSGRRSVAAARRCRELGITVLVQGMRDKVPAYRQILEQHEVTAAETCVVGDDFPDLPLLLACGLGVAVADAPEAIQERAHWVTATAGGKGAVREVLEFLLKANGKWTGILEHYSRPIFPEKSAG